MQFKESGLVGQTIRFTQDRWQKERPLPDNICDLFWTFVWSVIKIIGLVLGISLLIAAVSGLFIFVPIFLGLELGNVWYGFLLMYGVSGAVVGIAFTFCALQDDVWGVRSKPLGVVQMGYEYAKARAGGWCAKVQWEK
jgi:hypothetical protein